MSFNAKPSHCKNIKLPPSNLAPSTHFRSDFSCLGENFQRLDNSTYTTCDF